MCDIKLASATMPPKPELILLFINNKTHNIIKAKIILNIAFPNRFEFKNVLKNSTFVECEAGLCEDISSILIMCGVEHVILKFGLPKLIYL